MDHAQNLIRSVVRAFYPPDCILIIDAVVLHSALRDDDLAALMGSQIKHIRKLCTRLREDGLLNVHTRAEIKEGATKAILRYYYYINLHHAIDVIKFKLKSMTREVERRWGQSEDEKKEYFCDTCKSEWTQMEVLDNVRPDGEFGCKKCGSALRADYEQNSVGHEMQSRLNAQLAPFEKLMRQIDDEHVPENDFEAALANARPVHRDPTLNPVTKSEVAPPRGNLPAATVYGMKTEQDKIQVSLHDEAQAKKEEAEEAEKKAKLAAQNALPEWYTTSTVTGEQTALGMKEEAARREREVDGLGSSVVPNGVEAGEDKKPAQAARDNSQLESYFAAVREEQMKQNREDEDEDEDEDSEGEDDDEDEEIDFEDIAMDEQDSAPASKRVKIEEPGSQAATANGLPARVMADDSAAASASSSTGNSTPITTPAAPADEKPAANDTPKSISGEDSDEDEFEDVV